ncbi:MAG: glycosyltransferase family 2 protein [Ignavibacteriaceae bacterium]|nr:glycosyltransferase family 2 protein [Ignavibacteriaceae bacterium]
MSRNKRVLIVLPAYNAAKTIERTYKAIPMDYADDVLLVDDKSSDETVRIARELGIKTILHDKNRGYGGNQKTCYKYGIETGADIIIMLHPDYQYTPKLIPVMVEMLLTGEFNAVFASRILGGKALKQGMPIYKYFSNRLLTFIQNILLGAKLSEYHTGYRAYTKEVLSSIPFELNSDGFVFDNELIAQVLYKGYSVGEITCPTKYETDSSSINFLNSVKYGLGCLKVSLLYRLNKLKIIHSALFRFNEK